MGTPFVEGWSFVQVLGEGAYGEVQLAVNDNGSTAVAVKIIPLSADKARQEQVRKEMLIQRMCNHEHIIRLYGKKQDADFQYLILEYAAGGELFDRIEPDRGMGEREAQRLFRQLISAVEYLFEKGIAHRDLKPENLLLDDMDNLKIADFGLATVFRHKGEERKLDKCCGTYPYVAPEVLAGRLHRAQPADIWSCGIILVAMLAGELPWDQPSVNFDEYRSWTEGYTALSPFGKLDVLPLSLLKKLLEPNPSARMTIQNIKEHRWYRKPITKSSRSVVIRNGTDSSGSKRLRSGGYSMSPSDDDSGHPLGGHKVSYSQPDPTRESRCLDEDGQHASAPLYSFSQPVDPDNMLLSQIPCTPSSSSQGTMQRLVKRMTRYYVMGDREQVISDLHRACTCLGYTYKKNSANNFTIVTTDRRNMNLVFKAALMDINGLLLDFRLSKGDGIEFKKCFTRLKLELDYLVCHSKEPPMLSQASQDV